jgi:hypothetical protein
MFMPGILNQPSLKSSLFPPPNIHIFLPLIRPGGDYLFSMMIDPTRFFKRQK